MTPIVKIPQVLLPCPSTDCAKWATVACDQFSAEPDYWQKLEAYVGDAPSTLRLVIPEIFLNGDTDKRIDRVHQTMSRYIEDGLLAAHNGIILVEREVSGGKKRIGLILSVDLDAYDWRRVRVPIRATEDTIMSRLPPRVEIRKKAQIELPHALILIDDDQKEIIEERYAQRDSYTKLYDFELNMGGGRITGYAVPDAQVTLDKLYQLLKPSTQIKKYGKDAGILFAVGDGNHSLATAKTYWEELKAGLSPEEREDHPARYMLVEAVNIYGGGMEFQPIHRFVYNTDGYEFLAGLSAKLKGNSIIRALTPNGEILMEAPENSAAAITHIQEYIEAYLQTHAGAKVEYVHNADRLKEVILAKGGIGLVMPAFPQSALFDYVVNVGNLPKKAFSIGEPEDKRYYLEAKSIVNNLK